MKLLLAIILFILVSFVALKMMRDSQPLPIEPNKPYYLTIDEQNNVWLGELPGQKQMPLYDENGKHLSKGEIEQ